MRKVLYLLTALVAFGQIAKAQTYYPVTHTTGMQTVGSVDVTVTKTGNALSVGDICGPNTSPYFIGQTTSSGYNYSFNKPVTHVRMYFAKMHLQDEIVFTINGSHYNVQPADLINFSGTCGLQNTQTINANNNLTMTNAQGVDGGVQVDIQVSPAFMNTISVYNQVNGTNPDGAAYSFFIALDSCEQRFEAWADTPTCSTRDLNLHAYGWPGATYEWSTNTSGWTSNQQDPVRANAAVQYTGDYYVKVTRGPCVYYDTVQVIVDSKPSLTMPTQIGPVCPGFADTIITNGSGLGAGGTYNFVHPNGTLYTYVGNRHGIPTVSINDTGKWLVYAESINGCYSDTQTYNFRVHKGIDAFFSVDTAVGCGQDTVLLTNLSTSDTSFTSSWTFGDGGTSNSTDPVHIYNNQGTYTIKLIATTGFCTDSFDKSVTIDHPVVLDFSVDKDSICQGERIELTNNSYVTPGTQAKLWLWDFGTGDTSQSYEGDTFYTYQYQGEYLMKLIVIDFLGCTDTSEILIVVDSSGFVDFGISDDSICIGEAIDFNGTYNRQGNTGVFWTFGDGVIINDSTHIRHVYENASTYNVRFDATYRICPNVSQTIPVFVGAYPIVDLGPDTTICLHGEPVWIEELNNSSDPNAKFVWNTPTRDATPGTYLRHPGVYSVTVDINGCASSDSVEVKRNCYINIPNAFTPNGDGYNDYFLPRQLLSRNVTEFNMQIFNRWGQIVFETNSLNGRGWDGKMNDEFQPNGVYIYLINVSFGNNTTERYQGNVTLMR